MVDSADVSLTAMRAALTAHYTGKKMDVTAAFAELDADRSGSLSRSEVETGLATLGLLLGPEDVDAVMLEMDQDADGQVTRAEFTGWWVATTGATESMAVAHDGECCDDHDDGDTKRGGCCEASRETFEFLVGDYTSQYCESSCWLLLFLPLFLLLFLLSTLHGLCSAPRATE